MIRLYTLLLLLIIASCGKSGKDADPIIGKWHLRTIKDSVYHPLDSCQQKSSIEATDDNRLLDSSYTYDPQIQHCKVYGSIRDRWYAESAGSYKVDPTGITDQKQHITLEGDTLIYYYEAWSDSIFSGPGPITAMPTWKYYTR